MQKLTGLKVIFSTSSTYLCALMIGPGFLSAEVVSDPDSSTGSPAAVSNTAPAELPSALDASQDLVDMTAILGQPEALAKSDLDTLAARLTSLEAAVSRTHELGLNTISNSNHLLLVSVCTVTGVGVFIMLLLTRFQVQAMQRLSLVAGGVSVGQALAPPQATAALNAVERLDKRLRALEDSAFLPSPSVEEGHLSLPNASSLPLAAGRPSVAPRPALVDADSSRTSLLINKADTLLSLNHPDQALACLDEAIALAPHQTAALLKRGLALERLSRIEEAIAAYDRVLEVDRSTTLAYLYKGGLFNRLERYGEALECYQQALQTQDESVSPAECGEPSAVSAS